MKPSLQQKTSQGLAMTQQLQQAIFLLQLSSIELKTEIQEKLESNLMLEIEEDEVGENSNEQSEIEEASSNNQIEDTDIETIGEENFENTSTNKKTNSENQSTAFEFEEEDGRYKTLQEHLRWQLNLIPISDNDKVIAETIIDSLNDDGFLDCALKNILDTIGSELEETGLEEVEAVLKIIQSLDPVGVGARDLKECLLIQLRQFDQEKQKVQKAKELIDGYFDILAIHDYKQLMKKLKLTEKELEKIISFIQTMNPRPGSHINNTRTEYIIPDINVEKENNKWVVRINRGAIPALRINSEYKKMIKRADNSADNQTLKSHLQEADWLIKSLQHRYETLLNVSTCIVEHQRDFLEHGEEAMKPLILQDIANALGLHESTISRATTCKYMHTPRGTYELKYFFASHVRTDRGGIRSSTAIRALIKKMIDNELPNKPLSDNKITALLKKEGINVARRTIAKYREGMSIPPSNERKRMPK
tara:strand:+ start:679 stop:2109 length:1431 start_codon:yes stop_codon:yes gene_type:complete